MRLSEVLPLIPATVTAPRPSFRALLDLHLDRALLWQMLVAVACVTALLFVASMQLALALGGEPLPVPLPQPLMLAVIEFAMLALMALLIYWGGRMVGGTGELADSLLAVIWLQTVLNTLQIAQLVVMLLSPTLSGLIGVASVVLAFWLITVFIAELHGFRSLARTFAGVLIGLFGLAMALMPVLAMIGIGIPEATHV
jgi:hypothetical protein